MNTKALAVIAVIVALLMGWLLVNISQAPSDTTTEVVERTEVIFKDAPKEGDADNAIETTVSVDADNYEAVVEIAE